MGLGPKDLEIDIDRENVDRIDIDKVSIDKSRADIDSQLLLCNKIPKLSCLKSRPYVSSLI